MTNALFGLSCPTEALCVAGGKYGQLLTTTDPGADRGCRRLPRLHPPPGPASCTQPRATLRIGARAAAPTVAFRFAGTGTGPFYFRCQLDKRPGGLCSAPRKYRVGAGNHVFRVRAFGPGGGDPTPLVYKFRVLRAKPKPRPKA